MFFNIYFMKKWKFFLPALALLIIAGAGCSSNNSSETKPTQTSSEQMTNTEGKVKTTPTADTADHSQIDHLAKLAGSRIDLENRNDFKPGEVTFTFKLYGLDGHEFGPDDLKVTHEKKMHFLMVRDDMTGFQHLHPEYKDKKWTVKTASTQTGEYQLYVDVEPIEEKPTVLRVPVTIGGATVSKTFPTPNTDQSATDGVYKAVLKTNGALKTNEHTNLNFTLTKNDQAVKDIKPYLGAYGHVVLLRHTDPDDFFHVHPITEIQPQNGSVEFEAQFPVKGRYTLYAQFNVENGVKTFPITVDVNEEGTDTEVHSEPSEPSNEHHGG